jgi:hypothetical protein
LEVAAAAFAGSMLTLPGDSGPISHCIGDDNPISHIREAYAESLVRTERVCPERPPPAAVSALILADNRGAVGAGDQVRDRAGAV